MSGEYSCQRPLQEVPWPFRPSRYLILAPPAFVPPKLINQTISNTGLSLDAMLVIIIFTLMLQLAHVTAFITTYNGPFHQWYPQWRQNFLNATHQNCSAAFHAYLTEKPPPNHPEALAAEMVRCLLSSVYVDEGMKTNMASAAVLLGLLPTILALVGSSTAEVSLLGLRRPVFALFLATGSPAVSPIRNYEYHDPIERLSRGQEHVELPDPSLVGK